MNLTAHVCSVHVGVSPLDVRVLPQTKLVTNSVYFPRAELGLRAVAWPEAGSVRPAPIHGSPGRRCGRRRRSLCHMLDAPPGRQLSPDKGRGPGPPVLSRAMQTVGVRQRRLVPVSGQRLF